MSYQAFQQTRIDAGLCKDCGAERGKEGTTVFCRACATRHNQRAYDRRNRPREQWRRSGSRTCNGCGSALPDGEFNYCDRCRAYARKKYAAATPKRKSSKRAQGICLVCRSRALPWSAHCRWHFLGNVLRKHGISTDQYELFWAKLEKQQFRCFYTGVELVPGRNASLDHRVPRSRGGSPTGPDNCVWCDRLVNAFKNDLTEEEFVERCRVVVALAEERSGALAASGRGGLAVGPPMKRQPPEQEVVYAAD